MHPIEIIFSLPMSLAISILGEWIDVKDISSLDHACITNSSVRNKLLELLKSPYFSTGGTTTEIINEIEYLEWLAIRNISPRLITLVNPKMAYSNTVHGELFRALEVSSVERLVVNGKDEVAFLVKRICRGSKRLNSLLFFNLAWLTYPKLRGILKDCWRTLRILHIDTIKHLHGPYFAQIAHYLVHLTELMLGRIDLSPILLDALTKHCRQLTTLQFTSCPIYESTLITFIQSFTQTPTAAVVPRQRLYASATNARHDSANQLSHQCSSQLRSIMLTYNTGISLQAVSHVISSTCTSLTKLCLVGDYSDAYALTSDALIYASKSLPQLQHLDVSKNNYITDMAVTSVTENCVQLRMLSIHSCRRITDTSVAAIARNCTCLMYLDLSWCDNITNNALQLLRGGNSGLRTSLRQLRINSCYRITSLEELKNLISKCKFLTMKDSAMNPNAAAFSLLLKQREAQANQGYLSNDMSPQAWPQQPYIGQNQQYYQPLPPQPLYNNGMMYPQFPQNQIPSVLGNLDATLNFRPPPPVPQQPPSFMATQYPSFYPSVQQQHQQQHYQQQYHQQQHQEYNPQRFSNSNNIQSIKQGRILNKGSNGKFPSTNIKSKPALAAPPTVEETGQWYCEPCDKEFTQRSAFDTHTATHESCRHPGCSFSATKKVVMAHFHGAHGQFSGTGYKMIDVEGQKFRVLMGQSPEEIAQWRADRRRKFPTAAVEEDKRKQEEALIAAGGIVPSKPTGKLGKKRTKTSSGNTVESPAFKVQKTNDGDSVVENGEDREVFNNVNEEDADATATTTNTNTNSMHGTAQNSSYKRRCVHWGRGRCKAGDKCTFSHDFEPKLCDFFVRGHCKNGYKCYNMHDTTARNEYRANNGNASEAANAKNTMSSSDQTSSKDPSKKPMRNAKGELSIPEPLAGGERGTLWRKLLEDQIDKEENLILQCLRYIVQNNFLQGTCDNASGDGSHSSSGRGVEGSVSRSCVEIGNEDNGEGTSGGVGMGEGSTSHELPALQVPSSAAHTTVENSGGLHQQQAEELSLDATVHNEKAEAIA